MCTCLHTHIHSVSFHLLPREGSRATVLSRTGLFPVCPSWSQLRCARPNNSNNYSHHPPPYPTENLGDSLQSVTTNALAKEHVVELFAVIVLVTPMFYELRSLTTAFCSIELLNPNWESQLDFAPLCWPRTPGFGNHPFLQLGSFWLCLDLNQHAYCSRVQRRLAIAVSIPTVQMGKLRYPEYHPCTAQV